MMSLDSGDQQVSIVPPTPAADKQSVEMVEVDTSSDNEQWLELVNKPLIPEGVHWANLQVTQEVQALLEVELHKL